MMGGLDRRPVGGEGAVDIDEGGRGVPVGQLRLAQDADLRPIELVVRVAKDVALYNDGVWAHAQAGVVEPARTRDVRA